MTARSYYKRWLKTAFGQSLGPIDLWSGIAGACLSIAARYIPQIQSSYAEWQWQIPIWACATVLIVRVIAAPYWMAREQAAEIAKFKADALTVGKKQTIKSKLAEFLQEGEKLKQRCQETEKVAPIAEAQDWLDRLRNFVNSEQQLGSSFDARLNSAIGIPPRLGGLKSREHDQICSGIETRLYRLHEFLREFN